MGQKISFGSLLILFLVAFDPKIPLMPSGIGFTLLVSIFLLPVVILKLKYNGSLLFKFQKYNHFFFVFTVCLIFILFRLLIDQGVNTIFILSWFKAFAVYLACLFTYLVFFSNRPPEVFIKSICIIYAANAFINIIVGTYPDTFQFLEIFKSKSEISQILGKNPYRDSFISGSGYYNIGTAYAIIVMLLSFIVAHKSGKKIYLLLSIALFSITGFVAARTAFFGISLAFIYLIIYRIGYSIALLFFLLITTIIFLSLPALQGYREWMLSFFNLTSDSSASHLLNKMYFWPGELVFLVGKGVSNDGTYTYTDGGFMLDIIFGGIIFMTMKIAFVFKILQKNIIAYPLFTLLLISCMLIFHIKGLFMYNNAQGMAAVYFVVFHLTRIKYFENDEPKNI